MADVAAGTSIDIEEIKKLKTESEDTFRDLHDRMDEDFDLFRLVPFKAKAKAYNAYTSPAPRNWYNKVAYGINSAVLTVQIRVPRGKKDEGGETKGETAKDRREKTTKGEQFVHGALGYIDRKFRKKRRARSRQQLTWYMCVRGWVAASFFIYTKTKKSGVEGKAEDKDTIFDLRFYDPRHTYWEDGDEGPVWVIHEFKMTRRQVLSEYGIEIEGKEATCWEYLDEQVYAVVVGDEWGIEPYEHGLDYCPAFIGAVGDMPTVQDSTGGSTLEVQGDSIYSSSKLTYKHKNKFISYMMDWTEKHVAGSMVIKSKGAKRKIVKDPFRSWQVIPLDETDVFEPVPVPKAPPEAAAVLGGIDADEQQSTLPYPISYGGTTQPLSGAALGVLTENTQSVYSKYCALTEDFFLWLVYEMFGQFQVAGGLKTTLTGYHNSSGRIDSERTGDFFEADFTSDDIDPDWYVEVICKPRLPRDMDAEIQRSIAARTPRPTDQRPLYSDYTIRDRFMQDADPDGEDELITKEIINSHPDIVFIEQLEQLIEQGEKGKRHAQFLVQKRPDIAAHLGIALPQGSLPGQTPTTIQGPGPDKNLQQQMMGGMPAGPMPSEQEIMMMAEEAARLGLMPPPGMPPQV